MTDSGSAPEVLEIKTLNKPRSLTKVFSIHGISVTAVMIKIECSNRYMSSVFTNFENIYSFSQGVGSG